MEGFGERVLSKAKENGLNQKELAELIGVTPAALSRYLNNEREPRMEIVANMATALNTTTDYLICGKGGTDSFEDTYRLVARGSSGMSIDQKMKLIKVLTKNE